MRPRFPFLTAGLAVLCICPAVADDMLQVANTALDDANTHVYSCLDRSLSDVERAHDDLLNATQFIVSGLCAQEVAVANRAARASREALRQTKLVEACGEMPERMSSDSFSISAEIDFDASAKEAKDKQIRNCWREKTSELQKSEWLESNFEDQTSSFVAHASHRLLEKRIARLDSEAIGDN